MIGLINVIYGSFQKPLIWVKLWQKGKRWIGKINHWESEYDTFIDSCIQQIFIEHLLSVRNWWYNNELDEIFALTHGKGEKRRNCTHGMLWKYSILLVMILLMNGIIFSGREVSLNHEPYFIWFFFFWIWESFYLFLIF